MKPHLIAKRYTLVLLLVAAVVAGCNTMKTAAVSQSDMRLPTAYETDKDSSNTANLPLNQFFEDPHLMSLLDTALQANPDVLTAYQRIEIANSDVLLRRSMLFPAVGISATAGVEKYGDYTMNGVGNFDTNLSDNLEENQRIPNPTTDFFLGFRSSWEVDLWGKLRNRKRAAMSRYLASQNGYRMVITSLASQIAGRYYELLALDNELSIIKKNIVLQQQALEIIQVQKLGGRATELAVQQFRAQLLHTQSLEYTTRQQIAATENELNFLAGRFSRPIQRDTIIAVQRLPNIMKSGVPSQLLLNRPDIREAEHELAANNANIRAARAAFLPSLVLTPYVGYNSFNAGLLFNPASIAYGIIGGLSGPLVNRGGIRANYKRSVAEGKQALYNYQKHILGAYREVMTHLKGMENYHRMYEIKQQEVAALDSALGVSNDLYLAGRANYLEVITAQRNVLDAELTMVNMRKDIYLNAINLYRSLGGGWR